MLQRLLDRVTVAVDKGRTAGQGDTHDARQVGRKQKLREKNVEKKFLKKNLKTELFKKN